MHALLTESGARPLGDWREFAASWSRMPRDRFMGDGGRYRRRRHATLRASRAGQAPEVASHQPHFQSVKFNELNGGIAREFEPVEPGILQGDTMTRLLVFASSVFGRVSPYSDWHVEGHQFRVEADPDARPSPTPEGIHRDGVSFVMMTMIGRTNITGGATSIYDPDNNPLAQHTLTEPLDTLIVNDERVRHGVDPIMPLDSSQPEACRDVLVVTFRYTSESTP